VRVAAFAEPGAESGDEAPQMTLAF
jgi:hypothetical protein